MNKLTAHLILCFASLCAVTANEQEPLIYDESTIVEAELRCPSPDGKWELVYKGRRHTAVTELTVADEIMLVSCEGHEIPLTGLFVSNQTIYKRHIIKQPWSPDGKWLAIPNGNTGYKFCRTSSLNTTSFNSDMLLSIIIKDNDGRPVYRVQDGHWDETGTFLFYAGLSGWLAPYRAELTDDSVSYKQIGKMERAFESAGMNK